MYFIIKTTFSFHATIFNKIIYCPFIAAPCTRQCFMTQVIVTMVSPNSWTHFWGFSVDQPRGGFSSGRFYGDCRYMYEIIAFRGVPSSEFNHTPRGDILGIRYIIRYIMLHSVCCATQTERALEFIV